MGEWVGGSVGRPLEYAFAADQSFDADIRNTRGHVITSIMHNNRHLTSETLKYIDLGYWL